MKAIVSVQQVEASVPDLTDNTADLDRLLQALGSTAAGELPLSVPYLCMTTVAREFRDADFKGYALLNNLEKSCAVVGFSADKPDLIAAMALDLGTTHLEASLLNLQNGEKLATADLENAQIRLALIFSVVFTTPQLPADSKRIQSLISRTAVLQSYKKVSSPALMGWLKPYQKKRESGLVTFGLYQYLAIPP